MELKEICKNVRRTILTASFDAKACHLGSALSAVEILVDLYFNRMKPNDIFIFSKASGVSALYAVLAEKGIIPKKPIVQGKPASPKKAGLHDKADIIPPVSRKANRYFVLFYS